MEGNPPGSLDREANDSCMRPPPFVLGYTQDERRVEVPSVRRQFYLF